MDDAALNLAIKSTFLGTGQGKLTLASTALASESHGRRLFFTGFHADGTPFAVESAAFTGSPLERAAAMAQDILTTHTGVPFMSTPKAVSNIASRLRLSLGAALAAADKLANDIGGEVTQLNATVEIGRQVHADLKTANGELRGALGLTTNGGPDGPLKS